MKKSLLAIPAAVLVSASVAQAGTIFYDNDATYSSFNDSPFVSLDNNSEYLFWMENFESGSMDVPGVSVTNGNIMSPSQVTDSVDLDDSVGDGFGTAGNSYFINADEGNTASATITFDDNALGALPTYAGLVLTDAHKNAVLSFTFLDHNGDVLDQLNGVTYGNGTWDAAGATEEDRFIGANFDEGIYKIVINSSLSGIEIDHLQMGFEAAVIPLPPALALGAAGLGFVAARRRKLKA